EPRAVEIDAAIMDVIGILRRINAAGPEPDLAILHIDAIDEADQPFALGDLVFHRAGRLIDQVQMGPAVALRHPDDFAGRLDHLLKISASLIIASLINVSVVDERVARFIDDRAHRTRFAINADDAQGLMAALIVEEHEFLAGPIPMEVADAPRA